MIAPQTGHAKPDQHCIRKTRRSGTRSNTCCLASPCADEGSAAIAIDQRAAEQQAGNGGTKESVIRVRNNFKTVRGGTRFGLRTVCRLGRRSVSPVAGSCTPGRCCNLVDQIRKRALLRNRLGAAHQSFTMPRLLVQAIDQRENPRSYHHRSIRLWIGADGLIGSVANTAAGRISPRSSAQCGFNSPRTQQSPMLWVIIGRVFFRVLLAGRCHS